jgi:GAG-pre-integrase domain
MWTTGGNRHFKHLYHLIKGKSVMYDAEINTKDELPNNEAKSPHPDDIYEAQYDWDNVQNVKHHSSDTLLVNGTDTVTGRSNPSDELLDWHMRFRHMLMSRVQALAKEGIIPSRLAKCRVPVCASCMFGKLTKKPWRYKKDVNHIHEDISEVGGCVSVDQLESHVPELVAQIKGIPTRERYKVAVKCHLVHEVSNEVDTTTMFVDHASDYTFIYLQNSTSSINTVAAKKEFERHALNVGIRVQRYHADNGRFIDSLWMDHLKTMNRTMTLCGVNAHHQNGKVEKRIRDLQDIARSSMLYAQNLWPDVINNHLWPYAIRKAAYDLNNVKHASKELSPLE